MVTSHVAQKGYEVFSGSPNSQGVSSSGTGDSESSGWQQQWPPKVTPTSTYPLLGTLSSLGPLAAEPPDFCCLVEQGQDGPNPGRLENSPPLPGTFSAPSFVSGYLEMDGSPW